MMKALAALLVLAAVAGGGYFLVGRGGGSDDPVNAVTTSGEDGAAATAVALSAEAQEAKAEEEQPAAVDPDLPEKLRLYFPDGTWLPALNGAKNPKPVEFRDRPYAPVVRKAYDPKFKRYWYVHADGTWTTTVPSPFRGKMNTITQITHPGGEPNILLDEDGGKRRAVVPKKPRTAKKAGAK